MIRTVLSMHVHEGLRGYMIIIDWASPEAGRAVSPRPPRTECKETVREPARQRLPSDGDIMYGKDQLRRFGLAERRRVAKTLAGLTPQPGSTDLILG